MPSAMARAQSAFLPAAPLVHKAPTNARNNYAPAPRRPGGLRRARTPHASGATAADAAAIAECVRLASQAAGQTRPNPPVGCVLRTRDGAALGAGFHKRAGGPHAEVNALADAEARRADTVGATAYVSLEPCNHFGRTPPCSRALVRAGVARVVVGMVDPDPRVAGGGIRTLREAGVEVVVGVQEGLCQELTEGFVSRVKRKRPFGLLKYAMTLDGKIATESGSSKWVTGAAARGRVHGIRSAVDAIIVGGNTVRQDDPRLTVRDATDNPVGSEDMLSPIRVVMTQSMQLPREARLWQDARRYETVVLADAAHGEDAFVRELRERGVQVVEVPGLTPDDAMAYLYERDCLNVLWECGGALSAAAIKAGAVQKVHAFVAPKLVGGAAAPSPVGSPALGVGMGDAVELQRRKVETFENGDLLVTGYLE